MKYRRGKKVRSPNLTPLIDVVFQLLIFFMVTSTLIMSPGINLNLPSAETANVETPKEIIIHITENNQIFLNEEKIDNLSLLLTKLKAKVTYAPRKEITIKADQNILYRKLIEVMDVSRKAGFENIALAIQPKEVEKEEY